ncbi:YgcG family protein [Flavobacterium sp. 140616W15]|uniref:TPM domain-containing protein n=1 Tax=Flavobacterium sp. 140616W15 TaxID=2478552 RepID=UPI000F0C987D|nr:TPM domain-containing protein [Flavobacterium sp. 140616W15]AYN04613.1 TPM domain-containing protein [Flavobacterium sp. 140616W15]
MKKTFFIITITLFSLNIFFAQTNKTVIPNSEAQNIFSKTYNYVNDFEKILAPNQIEALKNTLKSYETSSGHKIIVVTTSSIQPYTSIPEYSIGLNTYLANQLKLNTAVLVILSKELRQIQIQDSEQISNKLNYDEIKSIISSTAIPEFKKGDYHKGLEETVNQIIKKLK